jgi:hypothetical protein
MVATEPDIISRIAVLEQQVTVREQDSRDLWDQKNKISEKLAALAVLIPKVDETLALCKSKDSRLSELEKREAVIAGERRVILWILSFAGTVISGALIWLVTNAMK